MLNSQDKGLIYVFTGNGKGKTTAGGAGLEGFDGSIY